MMLLVLSKIIIFIPEEKLLLILYMLDILQWFKYINICHYLT